MKPETRFGHWLLGVLPEGDYSRVEPPPSPGIPDLNFCISGVEGWIELKVLRKGRFPFAERFLRTSQKRWIRIRHRNRGRVFVLAKDGDYMVIWRGIDAVRMTASTSREDAIATAIARLRAYRSETLTQHLKYILTMNILEGSWKSPSSIFKEWVSTSRPVGPTNPP